MSHDTLSFLPDVSVIVPVYNEALTLKACIDSLLQLNYPREKCELIFVNNHSSDETGFILDSYRDRIRIIEEVKRGPAAARNAGLRHARSEMIALTDADCIVDRDWLQNLITPLSDPQIGIIGGKILSKPNGNSIETFAEHIYDHYDAIHVYKPPYAITMNWGSRLSILKQHGFFDETFIRCEDVDLSYRICRSGYKIVFQPAAVIYHHNERTLNELFHKGFLHGFHSIKVHKQYSKYLQGFGHKRLNSHSYKLLYDSFIHALLKQDHYSTCDFAFNAGKKVGKMLGSLRFLYLDL